jgi:hypothetical protein
MNGNCFVCSDPGLTRECDNRKWKGNKKSANVVIGETAGPSRYGKLQIDCTNTKNL